MGVASFPIGLRTEVIVNLSAFGEPICKIRALYSSAIVEMAAFLTGAACKTQRVHLASGLDYLFVSYRLIRSIFFFVLVDEE